MADDDVAVSDVLCEAMEYLSKLGSKLRSQSDVLKEKRIRRDKLKNSHAVKKAAEKVLLICELSKKSLENVESGVKNILTHVDASQQRAGSVGGKSTPRESRDSAKTSSDKKDIHYIEYKSRKLRIANKISLKHYTSVKVLARNMSMSSLEKYQVYHNCKLYRLRKKLSDRVTEHRLKEMKSTCNLDVNNAKEKCLESPVHENNLVTDRKKSECKYDSESRGASQDRLETKACKKYFAPEKDVIDVDSRRESNDSDKDEEEIEREQKKHQKTKDRVKDSKNDEEKRDEEEIEREQKKHQKTRNRNKRDEEEIEREQKKQKSKDGNKNDEEQMEKEQKKHQKTKNRNKDPSKKDNYRDKQKDSSPKITKNNISVIDLSSDEEEIKVLGPHSRMKAIYSDSDESDNKDDVQKSDLKSTSDNEVQGNDSLKNDKLENADSTNAKPGLKLVSLSKLLKPDVLVKVAGKTIKAIRTKQQKDNKLSPIKKIDLCDDEDEDFWATKRKEVNAFKAKEFKIKVIKLPMTFSEEFLIKFNIKKITQNDSVVFELAKESLNQNAGSSDQHKLDENIDETVTDPPDMDVIKNALLNDSDSENSVNLAKASESAKSTLLDDSDQDNNEDNITNNKIVDETDVRIEASELAKNTLLDDSDQDNNEDNIVNNMIVDDTDVQIEASKNAKSTLLDDSDQDNNEDNIANNEIVNETDVQIKDKELPKEPDIEKYSENAENENQELQSELREKTPECDVSAKTNETDIELAKSSLLENSNPNTPKTPQGEERRKSVSVTPSKRKHIRESIQAKKILLTHSSSSEEDDNMKEIRSELLKGSSDEEVTSTKVSNRRRLSTSDSDIDELLERVKKKRKIQRSKESGSDNGRSVGSDKDNGSDNDKSADCHKDKKAGPDKDKSAASNKDESAGSDKDKSAASNKDESDLSESVKEKEAGSVEDKSVNGSDTEKPNGHEDQSNENDADEKNDDNDRKADPSGNEDLQKDSEKEMDTKANSDNDDAIDNQSISSSKKMGRTREIQGSSSNSEGQDDKEIDGLTNMKTLTRSSRRRGSPRPEETHSKIKSKIRPNKSVKKSMFSEAGDGLLETTLSSDEASANNSSGEEEDLPAVPMTALNGTGGIERLAKEDLLGSESDGSHDSAHHNDNDNDHNNDSGDGDEDGDSEQNDKKDDSDSDTVKAPRRKGHTISSDSEAGSRRKNKNKDSDFEDSEADSEPTKAKRKKRQKKSSDDESAGSASEAKKKRRRIKSVNDSDASGSDSENEGKKHGRKNIRKVMGKNQLEEATKKAAREEKERMARIAERQKTYNNMQFDESGKPDEVILDRVVLDYDPDTKEPLIQVDQGLVKKLKPHQANGIKFMWDACFESVKRIKKDRGSGCILAHCMGLGKTLQVVSLTHTLLRHSELTRVERVLVVCPLSTVLNWVNEFRMWLEFADDEPDVDVYELSRYKQNSERAYQLSQWFKHGGVCVLGYEMFRNLSADNPKKFKKKMLKQFQESLVDPGPDMVVCDEGHLLKNEKTSLSQSMNRVRTRRRIVLTGTPLQNNLKEYYCMVQFVKPNLLGKYNEYLNRFVNPITNGQYTDSTEHDIKIMKRRSHVLHKMLDGAVQRRDYGVLAPFLPPKHEYVLFITLSEVQIKLYQHYLENYSRRPLAGKTSGFLFPDFQSLQRIWTHPLVLKYNSERYEIMQQKKRDKEEEDSEGSLVDFIDDDSTPDETSEDSSDVMSDVSDDSHKKSKKKKAVKKAKAKEARDARANNKRTTRANPELDDDMEKLPELPAEVRSDNPTEWWVPLVSDDELEDLRHSHKLVLLLEILRQCEAIGDKLLVFSQSLYSLDLIEHFLGKVDEATQDGRLDEKLGGHVGSWSPGVDYFRLDGSTSCENRSIWCKNFNREDNPRARLFLISTRAGGLGINLVAANRVVIFDVSWNPSHDVQSIFRVYRFGQKKPCYVYRFLAMGTMEEKIYERQVTKQAISKRVIDEQQIDRHYKENDLAELYTFEPRPPAPRPVPKVPKDRFFAEMLKDHEDLIYKFHEHDSLLENKEEETLSEEERKAAWDDFENEKNRPPPQPFANWPMHNGMMPNLLAAQQQQLAFAALGAVLRKDMPGLSEDQIRGMIPLIYGANPALMQKLNDMYKYVQPQPGMVNPAMMNPGVMGPGGAAMGGAAGVGSGSLQYSPPWQRQQQQQQQLRLQQLMQHQAMGQQQPMGAKLYAGGLGSRDPVAMALQQQRARDLMGERGAAAAGLAAPQGRARGRPPARHTGDVVNLDSD